MCVKACVRHAESVEARRREDSGCWILVILNTAAAFVGVFSPTKLLTPGLSITTEYPSNRYSNEKDRTVAGLNAE